MLQLGFGRELALSGRPLIAAGGQTFFWAVYAAENFGRASFIVYMLLGE